VLGNKKLREKLDAITDKFKGKGCGQQQEKQIKILNLEIPHSIEIVRELSYDEIYNNPYKCFEYCFDFRLDYDDKINWKDYKLNSFVSYLISKYLEEISQNNIKDDDYVIYFDKTRPVHAGKWNMQKVISKWGDFHLWKHGLWEIPTRYGCRVNFYKKIPKDILDESLNEYRKIYINDEKS
jgi:hypothetical protein